MIAGAIVAPILAIIIAIFTFFNSIFAIMRGVHDGLTRLPVEEKEENVWEKHIKRMKDASKLN
jgi:uncharacterized membrane protein